MILAVYQASDLDDAKAMVLDHASRSIQKISEQADNPFSAMRAIKFDRIGLHPMEDRPLNFIEQINQIFTFLTAISATELLMRWHPDAGGFRLAPGAHAPSGSLDIESITPGLVGAETFAAVSTSSNGKLKGDMAKLLKRDEQNLYEFFTVPKYPKTERQPALEQGCVQVWSIALPGN